MNGRKTHLSFNRHVMPHPLPILEGRFYCVFGLFALILNNLKNILFAFLVFRSPQTVKEKFMVEFGTVFQDLCKQISKMKQNGAKFSLTLDEATSKRNRRYMNINLHKIKGFISLGLVRIVGGLKAERALELCKKRVEEFGLNFHEDIIATSTDGAAVMIKFGRLSLLLHFTCLAHGIHLAVTDILYKKPKKDDDDDNDAVEDDDFDEFDDEIFVEEEPEIELAENFQEIIAKVRKIIKIFNKSPVKNDEVLQPQIMAKLGKEKSFNVDVKTRWNSLLYMLQNFYKVHKEMKYAMEQLNKDFDISEAELKTIKELIDALVPLEWLVKQLCHEDVNLIQAENLILFTLMKLRKETSEISQSLLERFETRIEQRWEPKVIHTLRYLENPAYLNEKTDQFGNKISRKVILDLITKLVQRLTGNEVHENNSAEVEIEVSENVEEPESDKNESLNDEFAKFLKDQTAKKGSEVKIQKVTNQRIDKEMKCYEANGTKTENLENLYKSLLTIKPTLPSMEDHPPLKRH